MECDFRQKEADGKKHLTLLLEAKEPESQSSLLPCLARRPTHKCVACNKHMNGHKTCASKWGDLEF